MQLNVGDKVRPDIDGDKWYNWKGYHNRNDKKWFFEQHLTILKINGPVKTLWFGSSSLFNNIGSEFFTLCTPLTEEDML